MKIFDFIPLSAFLLIIVIIVSRIRYLKKKGIQVSSGIGKLKKSSYFIIPVFVLLFWLWLSEIIKPVSHWSFSLIPELFSVYLFSSFILKSSGSIIIILSLTLLSLTLLHFKSSLRFGLDENNQGMLITDGVFSISRNPFFLSLDLYFLGVALILPNLLLICFAILAIVGVHFFILKEEKYLLKVYGKEYELYKQQVKRYIGSTSNN